MNGLVDLVNRLFDLLFGLDALSPAWAMVLVSAVTAVWVLALFKAVTPQDKLTRTRDRLFGHIYEMGMFQDHLGVVGRIQADLARANLRYLGLTLPALVALLVPMVVTLAQIDSRYARRPLPVGESTVVSVEVSDDAALDGLELATPDAVTVEAGPVRDRIGGRVAWRVRADEPGRHHLALSRDGTDVAARDLVAGAGFTQVNETSRAGAWHRWLAPGAAALDGGGEVASWTVRYPPRTVRYLGIGLDWLLAFMIFSLGAGLLLKDPMKVSI
jgi:hypothetical protein